MSGYLRDFVYSTKIFSYVIQNLTWMAKVGHPELIDIKIYDTPINSKSPKTGVKFHADKLMTVCTEVASRK